MTFLINKKGVSMLNINIICIGKIKENYLKDAISEYSKRLSKYCKLTITQLPDEKIPEKLNNSISEEIKSKECNNILEHIKKDSYIICLDLHGSQFTSEEFSSKLQELSMQTSNITFIIGGSLGLTDNLLKKSNLKICFSKMTFPHQLIRVFLLEQIFRAFKISNGETYHR